MPIVPRPVSMMSVSANLSGSQLRNDIISSSQISLGSKFYTPISKFMSLKTGSVSRRNADFHMPPQASARVDFSRNSIFKESSASTKSLFAVPSSSRPSIVPHSIAVPRPVYLDSEPVEDNFITIEDGDWNRVLKES